MAFFFFETRFYNLGLPEIKYMLIRVRTFNRTYHAGNKKLYCLRDLIDLKKRHTFLTEIFDGIKYIYEILFLKCMNFNYYINRLFTNLCNVLMIQLLKNSNMIISHKIYWLNRHKTIVTSSQKIEANLNLDHLN